MRICQIVPSLEERHGGPSRSVRQLAEAQRRLGDDVRLYATEPPGAPGPAEPDWVEVFPRTWPQVTCASRPLRAALARSDCELVHHHALWLATLAYARRTAARCQAPLVISPRGMMTRWSWRHRRWKKRLAAQFIHPGALAAAAGWHATSEEEAADIRALGFAQPVCVAPNGITPAAPAEQAEAAAFWTKMCPEVAQRPVAVFYSRFHRKKRVIELIDLWLERAPRDWLLLLVGIPQEYSPALLEDYVVNNLGQGRIKVYDGLGRPPPYAVASLFVLPSHTENFGLAIAEALGNSVPALVTDGTPWSRLEADGAGWCVPWERYGATLAAALAEGPAALKLRGARARALAERELTWEAPARTLAHFYAQLTAAPR